MTPYVIMLVLVVLIAYVTRRSRSAAVRHIGIGIVALILISFAGFRSGTVGTDTGTYIVRFLRATEFVEVVRSNEVGYNLLEWFARSISSSYTVLFLLVATVVVTGYLSGIVRTTRRYETAIFLFITLGAYTFFFNGARQGIAAAICFAALPELLKRNPIRYHLLILVAASFHQTALVCLVTYALAANRVSVLRLISLGLGAVALVASLHLFVSLATQFLGDRFSTYADAGDGGGEVWTAFLVCQGIIFYACGNLVQKEHRENYSRLLNVYLIGLVPALASVISGVNPSGVLRLHIYFSGAAILLWPIVFLRLGTTNVRALAAVGFLFTTLLFYVLTTQAFSRLVPYTLAGQVQLS